MKSYSLLPALFLAIGCSKTPERTDYTLNEAELVPEGIAYSQSTHKFYLTSVAKAKIIVVDEETGQQSDFITEGKYGFMPGVGIWVDDASRQLLALGGYFQKEDTKTTLFRFDLTTGALLQKYSIADTGRHFLNDLVMTRQGDVYITDTYGHAVYVLEQGSEQLKVYLQSSEIEYPNGIALSDDKSKLYIASTTKGIRVVDIKSKEILNAADTTGASNGIDGLELYNNSLYAVQNSVAKNGDNFRRLLLNDAGDQITGIEIIDSTKQNLNVPLTFCIAKDKAVVIGNSNLQYLNQADYSFPKPNALQKTKLVLYNLSNNK